MKILLSVIAMVLLATTGTQAGGLTAGDGVSYPTQWSQPQVLPNGRILPPMPTHFETRSVGVGYQANGTVASKPGAPAVSTNSLALLAAAERGDTNTIKVLLAKHVDIDTASPAGATALIIAAIRGQLPAARLLVDAGADMNAVTRDGKTALMLAVINGQTKIAKLLLDKKADLKVMDEAGKLAADYAVLGKRPDMLALFKAPPAK